MTSIQELEYYLYRPHENENLEFKEAKTQYDTNKLLRYCVAIANEGGGKIIFGITDRTPRHIVGTKAFGNLHKIQTYILEKLHFRVDTEELNHSQGRVIIFHIPSRPKGTAYQLDGAYLMRSTEDTVPMSEDKLRQIFNEGKHDWFLQIAKKNCSGDDVIKLLDTQTYFDMMKLPYPKQQQGALERLQKEAIITKQSNVWGITNLGAILFAKNLDDFDELKHKSVRIIAYECINKLKTTIDFTASKGYAVGFQEIIESIQMQTTINEVIEKAIRKTVKMYPDIAIRELVANALIHQDFLESGTSVMVEIYTDRIEISNPGLPLISTERFIDEYKSRNEKLADIMRRFGICEEKSSGIDKVVNAAEFFQLPAPDFRVGTHHTTVVLFAHKKIEDMNRKDRIRACYQHCCLRYVTSQRMTNQSLRARFKLSESKSELVSRIIHDALNEKQIKIEHPEKTSKRYMQYVPFWA